MKRIRLSLLLAGLIATGCMQTAKRPDTRAKRMLAIIAKLARGEKFH